MQNTIGLWERIEGIATMLTDQNRQEHAWYLRGLADELMHNWAPASEISDAYRESYNQGMMAAHEALVLDRHATVRHARREGER